MRKIIAMHGWGGDSSEWDLWKKYMQKFSWRWQSNERGYGEIKPKEFTWDASDQDPSNKRAIIAHSLGSHLLAPLTYESATDVIFFSSFGKFNPVGKDERITKTALNGMKKTLGSKTESSMLINFFKKSHSPNNFEPKRMKIFDKKISLEGRKKLINDLNLLINTQGIPKGISKNSRVLIIYGNKDKIVPSSAQRLFIQELRNYLSFDPLIWNIPDKGHSFSDIEVIKKVKDWLECQL